MRYVTEGRPVFEPQCRFVRLGFAVVLWLAASLPGHATAQIPGAKPVDIDRQYATFRSAILDRVLPVMESWQGAWGAEAGPPPESFYTPDAVVSVGDSVMGGAATLTDFVRSTRRNVADLVPSMLDFDASDGLAYLYGSWSANSARSPGTAHGRLVTILRNTGDGWMIRAQSFGVDSLGAGMLVAVEQAEPLPSVERRVAVGSRAVVPSTRGDGERQDERGRQRITTYRELVGTLAAMRLAWNADDPEALRALMRRDAWVQLPVNGDWAGRWSSADLTEVLPTFGSLHTAELDFDLSGSLAYLSGRYWVERTEGSPRSGIYVAVFKNLGSGWLIRSVVFF